MSKSIFVNLPVKDLQKSMAFFATLGWSHNPQFTDETAASIVISDTIYVMLLTHDNTVSSPTSRSRMRRRHRRC